nr:integrase, catalytic region, zinc finger, CCHC-type, peptidase aspartic, catalytic [Tanacetum cinerariifolium]
MILSGGENHPSILDKDVYDSWKSRMELYIENKEQGRMILESVKNGLLFWTTIKENGVTRTKKYVELSATDKSQADYDNFQGSMGKNSITNASLPPEWSKFVIDLKLARIFTDNNEELAFSIDPGVIEGPVTQTVITHNASYQANDLDAYDSEVPHSENTHNDIVNQRVQEIPYFEQTHLVNYTENKITSDSNIISYLQYLHETQNAAVQDTNSSTQQDAKILSMFEQLSHQKAQQIRPMLYDGTVIARETNVISITDSEDTLMLEEEGRSNMLLKQSDPMVLEKKVNIKLVNYDILNQLSEEFGKQFLPQTDISAEQVFWLNNSSSSEEPSAPTTPVKTNVPKELPKEKVFVITTLKNNLRKLKVKDIIDNAIQVSNATTIALGMYKLELVTLAPRNKNSRESHIYYLKPTIEQATILKEIVEQAKSLNPLDSASYSAHKYVKLIQEFLGYVRDTCPDIYKPSEKLVAVMPINMRKTVRNPDLSYLRVFGALFYPTNDSENLGKHQVKADIGTSWGSNTLVVPSSSSLVSLSTVKFGNDQIIKIMGYGDYQIGNFKISRVYYVEGLGHNLFSVVPEVEAPALAESTCTPFLTLVDQDEPSLKTSQTTQQSQSQEIPLSVEEDSHDLEVAHMSNDPYFGILIPEIVFDESSSSDIIHTTVHSDAPIS